MKKTILSKPVVLLVAIFGIIAFWKIALYAADAKSLGKGDVFQSADGKEIMKVTSETEMEFRGGDLVIPCKFTQQGDTLNVTLTIADKTQTVVFKVVADGITDPDGVVLLNPTALKTADKNGPGSLTKRQIAKRVLDDLRILDAAVDQYAIETNKSSGMNPTFTDLKNYLKAGSSLYTTGADIYGVPYGPFTVDSVPKVSEKTFNSLSDVANQGYWSPFY